jgi:hypothetical protein
MKKEIPAQPILDDLDAEFEEYRQFMFENAKQISKFKFEFISDETFSSAFKCERIQELIDFLILEENYDECAELLKIKNAVEIQYLLDI